MPPRALDHVVVPCRDLAAAARACADLGFTVGRRNRHPWGTENHLIQFPGAFVELVAPASDYQALAAQDDAFPFAGFLAGAGASRDPSGMIVLRSADAEADAAAFRAGGIGSGRTLHFARDGAAPDGTTKTVAFTLAFAELRTMPDVGFFVCRQHFPENFWNPDLQRHANGATAIAAVVIEAADPGVHAELLARFAGATAVENRDGRIVAALAEDGSIDLVPTPGRASPRLVGLSFRGAATLSCPLPFAVLAPG